MCPLSRLLALAVATVALATPVSIAGQSASASNAADFMPPDLAVVATVLNGDRQVQALHDLLDAHRFTESSTYRTLRDNPKFMQARITLAGLADAADTDVWSGIGALLGREFVIGLAPGEDEQPRFIAISVPRDEALIDRVLSTIYVLTGLERNGKTNRDRSRQISGINVFTLDNDVLHCRIDKAILLSNSDDLVRAAIECRQSDQESLADTQAYQRALERVKPDAVAWAYGDMNVLRKALAKGGKAPPEVQDALGAVLFGGAWHSILHAEDAIVSAMPKANQLTIELALNSSEPLPPTHHGFAPEDLDPPRWSAAEIPSYVGEIEVLRDWEDLFAERESIMSLSAAGDFVNFTSTLTTLMGQFDFVDELLANVSGPVKLVFARQDFSDRSYTPAPQLPSFALVIPMRFAEGSDIKRRLHSAALSAISILNVDAGQNDRPTFLLDVDRYRGHRIVIAEYPYAAATGMGMDPKDNQTAPDSEAARDGADATVGIAYNFAPATGVLDEHYLIATSPELLREIIDAIDTGNLQEEAADIADAVSISAPQVLAILRANRETLVTNSMLKNDKPREQAEAEIDTVFGALAYAKRLEFSMQRVGDGYSATLTLTLLSPRGAGE